MRKLVLLTTAAVICGSGLAGHSYAFGGSVPMPAAVPSSVTLVALDDAQLQSAEAFVGDLTSEALGFLSEDEFSAAQKKAKFKKLLDRKFDLESIGRFAMGRNWRTISDAQKKEYLNLFESMVIDVYSQRFSEYGGQDINVLSSRAEGKSDVIVQSLIVDPSGPNVKLDWRLRYKDGRFRVIDVIVAGVSMALTQRSDFSSVIQRGGGDVEVLLAHLRDE